MPVLQTANTTMYYDVFEADFTAPSTNPQTVLLIHGFAGTPESDFAGQLAPLRSRYRVIAPHLHGYGRSSQRSSYKTSFYRDDAADLHALLDVLGIEKVLVLGFSDGGITGILFTALYTERVQAMAALGAQPTINAKNVADIRHWLLESPLSEEWQKQLAELHGEPYWRSLPEMYVQAQLALVEEGGVIITEQEMASIHCPVLIMHGLRDRVVPADYARIIAAAIPGSQLLLFDAGHAAHMRCAKEFTEAVLYFFQDGMLPDISPVQN